MSTKSLMPDSSEDRIVAEPMHCSTIQMRPFAMSSREALVLALLKSDATALMGSPGRGLALMSLIRRLIFDTSPSFARFVICFMSSVLSIIRLRPASVPPPIPIPPMCLMFSPSHFTKEVCACAHAHNDHSVKFAFVFCSQSVCYEFFAF